VFLDPEMARNLYSYQFESNGFKIEKKYIPATF
jgi:hypothetical protein